MWARRRGAVRRAGRRPFAVPTRPLPITHSHGWSPEAPPLVGVQGAKPPGGVRGGAPALLRSNDHPAADGTGCGDRGRCGIVAA